MIPAQLQHLPALPEAVLPAPVNAAQTEDFQAVADQVLFAGLHCLAQQQWGEYLHPPAQLTGTQVHAMCQWLADRCEGVVQPMVVPEEELGVLSAALPAVDVWRQLQPLHPVLGH